MEQLAPEIEADLGIKLPKIIYVDEEELRNSLHGVNQKDSPHFTDKK